MPHQTAYSIVTNSADETRELGRRIGCHLEQAVVIRLLGDLGCGKTCFVQGLAKGLEVPEGYDVSSPTYTLIHEYPGRIPLAHVDLYRIFGEGDAETIGLCEMMGQDLVVAVEWADRLSDNFWPPSRTLSIDFHCLSGDSRRIRIFGYGLQMGNLIKEIGALWDNSPVKPQANEGETNLRES